MATAILTSPYDIPPQASNFVHESCNPTDDSFASYFAVVRDSLNPDLTITSARRPPPRRISFTRKLPDDDTEIGIFAAERYFSTTAVPAPQRAATTPVEKAAKPPPIPVAVPPLKTVVALTKSRSLTCTASVSSCVSSNTSRASHGALHPERRRAFNLGGMGFLCSTCSRKYAVNVEKASGATESVSHISSFIEQNQNSRWSPASWRIEAARTGPCPWPESTGLSTSTLQLRRMPLAPPLSPLKVLAKEEDTRSESSSDLFEIESVALSRTEGAAYEPSEASITWSVMTASAANVALESDRIEEIAGKRGQGRKRPGNLLSGCSSQKAVEVMEQRAAGEKDGLPAAGEVECSLIAPVVARYHVEIETGGGSGRIVAGLTSGSSWHGGSGRIML